MEAIKCSRGHYYDKALGSCPVCAAEAGNAGAAFNSPFVTNSSVPDDIPATSPATGGFDIPATVPASEGFVQAQNPFVDIPTNVSPAWAPDSYEPTMPTPLAGEEAFDPIVGWLICIKGPNRGKDYRLHSGTNFIGRSKSMDVCIENDRSISNERHASVTYDERSRTFYIQKGEVRNATYLNGRALRSDADLVIYDRIELGGTELMFVPLCTDQFNWKDI